MNIPALPDTRQLLHQAQRCKGLALPQHPTSVPMGVPIGNRARLSGRGAGNAVCAHNLHCSLGCCTPHMAEPIWDRKCTFLPSRWSLESRVLLALVQWCSRRPGKLPKGRDPGPGQSQRSRSSASTVGGAGDPLHNCRVAVKCGSLPAHEANCTIS